MVLKMYKVLVGLSLLLLALTYADFKSRKQIKVSSNKISSEKRLQLLENSCAEQMMPSKLTHDELQNVLHHILVNDEHGILYCYVPKVACSNWKRVLAVLNHKVANTDDIKEVDHDNVERLSWYSGDPTAIEYRLKNYFKFMFVREPLQRLVSAYKDKLLMNNTYYTEVAAIPIMRKFRPFTGKGDQVPRPWTCTLEEFFMHLESKPTQTMDDHWMPMYELCQPCAIKYDFIGSLENVVEDSKKVLEKLNITDIVQFPKQQEVYKSFNRKLPKAKELLNETPRQLTKRIIQKYRTDYELFHYSIPDLD